jgi:hypothetical protein
MVISFLVYALFIAPTSEHNYDVKEGVNGRGDLRSYSVLFIDM